MPGTLLSIGHGYSARALACLLLPAGWRVIGTTRSPDRARVLRAEGVEPLIWDGAGADPALLDALGSATHVLSSVAPKDGGDPVLAALGGALRTARHLRWAGYLSTTSVYGDHGGGWVDEDTPPVPGTRRGQWRLAAEQAWRAVCAEAGAALHIYRLAGIYGPGRSPFARIRAGQAQRVVKPGQVFSRIHVDDIAQAVAAGMTRPGEGARIYNLCDDLPAPPQDVIAHAAQLLGLPPPPEEDFATASLSAMARDFYSDNKRVRNERMKSELMVRLHWPDYRAGLAAVLAAETAAAAG